MELIDIEHELKHFNDDDINYDYWNYLSFDQIKLIARRYELDALDPIVFSIIWNFSVISKKQRYYIIHRAAQIEKTYWE